jgi:hypothetical protein
MQNEINELRNQIRTLKRMLFGVFGLVVVGGVLAATTVQSVPDLIQAKKFEVVNDEGKTVVAIYALADGGTNTSDNTDESCCQHPHHSECVVNTTSWNVLCQHRHHLECVPPPPGN